MIFLFLDAISRNTMNCNLDIQKTNYPFLLFVIIQDILIFCALESDFLNVIDTSLTLIYTKKYVRVF